MEIDLPYMERRPLTYLDSPSPGANSKKSTSGILKKFWDPLDHDQPLRSVVVSDILNQQKT